MFHEELPDLLGPKGGWYKKHPMIRGTGQGGMRLTYKAQRESIKAAFEQLGIYSTKVTHSPRKVGSNRLMAHDVAVDAIMSHGGWSHASALLK